MKRTVFSLSFFFLLFTLSYARNVIVRENPTHFHDDHHHLSIKPSSDGAESSTILLPTESSPVLDHTQSHPFEAINEVDFDHHQLINRHPIHLKNRLNRFSFQVFRFNPLRCRHHRHRFSRYPRRFVGIDEMNLDRNNVDLNLDFPAESKVLLHRHVARNFPEYKGDEHHRPRHHHHHHHHDHDDRTAEMMREVEKDHDHDHEHEHEHEHREKKLWNKILHKFLGYF